MAISEIYLKLYYFLQNLKRPKNANIVMLLANRFKKGQMATLSLSAHQKNLTAVHIIFQKQLNWVLVFEQLRRYHSFIN
jgi:hypothetical protein